MLTRLDKVENLKHSHFLLRMNFRNLLSTLTCKCELASEKHHTLCTVLAFSVWFSLYISWLDKFYYGIIARRHLQLINTSINFCFSKL